MTMRSDRPTTNDELRQALYQGVLFRWPATASSLRLVKDAMARLEHELEGNLREAQFRFSDADFFERIGRLRKLLYTEKLFQIHVQSLLAEQGFDPAHVAFDPIRLRVVTHRGFENPRAAPIYYAHRDTWYAHSQAELTWWIPLHDVTAEETFVFYPDWFARAVPNNSEQFDYDAWTAHGAALRIGWQDREHGATQLYPGQVGAFDPGREIAFAASAGEIVMFAGANFHQTRKNSTGRTRFSLDFRTVNLADHASGRGAPNVDNRSTGSAVRDYVQPDRARTSATA